MFWWREPRKVNWKVLPLNCGQHTIGTNEQWARWGATADYWSVTNHSDWIDFLLEKFLKLFWKNQFLRAFDTDRFDYCMTVFETIDTMTKLISGSQRKTKEYPIRKVGIQWYSYYLSINKKLISLKIEHTCAVRFYFHSFYKRTYKVAGEVSSLLIFQLYIT